MKGILLTTLVLALAAPLAQAAPGQYQACDSHQAYLAGRMGKSLNMQCTAEQAAAVNAAYAKGLKRAKSHYDQNARAVSTMAMLDLHKADSTWPVSQRSSTAKIVRADLQRSVQMTEVVIATKAGR